MTKKAKTDARHAALLETLSETLKDAGLRSTKPRVAVLTALASANEPLTHAEVTELLARGGFDRATVYRNLVALADLGLVSRSDRGDHVWRFEIATAGKASHEEEHPHFLCTACGTVACLPEGSVRLVKTRGTPRAVAASDVQVQLKGRCDACAE